MKLYSDPKSAVAGLILCVCSPIGLALPPSTDTASAPTASALQSALPTCMNAESDIAAIQQAQKVNAGTPRKYDGYRKVLHADTDIELATRLAYAETVAANCPEQEERIAELIASVIGNRVRIRRGDVKSVIFQRDQFASSLNLYFESRYRDFLCPDNSARWNGILRKMRANLEAPQPVAPVPEDAVNYYLYRHSDRLKAPSWNLAEVPTIDEKTRECIRVFRAPGWK